MSPYVPQHAGTPAAFNPTALTDGRWVTVRGIKRWVSDHVEEVPDNSPDAIACPVCKAKACQPCRTSSGALSGAHAQRQIPRCCPCGGPVASKTATFCIECRKARIDAHSRDSARKHRARRRAAAQLGEALRVVGVDFVPSTPADRCIVVGKWVESGRPLNSLEELTGWNARRYLAHQDVAS